MCVFRSIQKDDRNSICKAFLRNSINSALVIPEIILRKGVLLWIGLLVSLVRGQTVDIVVADIGIILLLHHTLGPDADGRR